MPDCRPSAAQEVFFYTESALSCRQHLTEIEKTATMVLAGIQPMPSAHGCRDKAQSGRRHMIVSSTVSSNM